MNKNVEEKSLIDALSFCSLRKLPAPWDKENIYLLALALVAKSDGTKSYVALKKNKDGKDAYVKDFGNVSAIKNIIEIYPYQYLDAKFLPSFKTRTKEERITWLNKIGGEKDYSDKSLKELDKCVLNLSMQLAINTINAKTE